MGGFTGLLSTATEVVAHSYIALPILDGTEVYRERVYCYELCHRLRLIWTIDVVFACHVVTR